MQKLTCFPGPWTLDLTEGTVIKDANGESVIGNLREPFNELDPKWQELTPFILALPELVEAVQNANTLISQMMPGVAHIALQDYAFLNETCMQLTAVINKINTPIEE